MAIKFSKGFTLVEMMVVVGIFAMVATVLLFNYSNFSTTVAVRTLAQDIGLSVRKAQAYAISVRSITGAGGMRSDMFPAYGISFSVDGSPAIPYAPSTSSFSIFADVSESNNNISNYRFDNNGVCGGVPGIGQECVESLSIKSSTRIVSLCTDSPNANSCFTPQTGGTVNVVFRRPNPDAVICVVNPGGNCIGQPSSYLKVTVQSSKGTQRVITIWNTGQISIN